VHFALHLCHRLHWDRGVGFALGQLPKLWGQVVTWNATEFSEERTTSVESRMGAVAWGLWPTPRFPSPLIKPDVPISGIRLSDRLHRNARDGTALGRR